MAAYIAQLTPMEQKILNIAASHLETSFSLSKSIGFLEWQAEQHKQAQQPQASKSTAAPSTSAAAPSTAAPSTSAAAPSTSASEAPRKKIKIFIKKKLNPALP